MCLIMSYCIFLYSEVYAIHEQHTVGLLIFEDKIIAIYVVIDVYTVHTHMARYIG